MATIKRNVSIDILKFLAVLLITNSHFDIMYAHFDRLATGGAFGDALFFFCSGFTLFLGRMGRFDNWYKRRIGRIYPSVFGWTIVASFCFCSTNSMRTTILRGGGGYITPIMFKYLLKK